MSRRDDNELDLALYNAVKNNKKRTVREPEVVYYEKPHFIPSTLSFTVSSTEELFSTVKSLKKLYNFSLFK